MLFSDDSDPDPLNHLGSFNDHLGNVYCKKEKNSVHFKQNVQSSFLYGENNIKIRQILLWFSVELLCNSDKIQREPVLICPYCAADTQRRTMTA